MLLPAGKRPGGRELLPEALLLYYTTILTSANKDRINSTKKAASAASPGDTAIEEYHRTASELIIREIIINLDPGNLPVMAFPPYVKYYTLKP